MIYSSLYSVFQALEVSNPYLMTFATLTGHVILSYGSQYTALISNGPAQKAGMNEELRDAGSLLGDMHEISTLRREDFEAHNSPDEYADLVNSARPIDGKRCRGHQSPAAFMIAASGLDAHMCSGKHPLPYTHFDIAGSQGLSSGFPTGVPILTLCSHYLLKGFFK
ncbi:putative aminopeptidase [Fasciolopsis buskii]|uniref:Putative aminopeptidase n=1 Tax=Fasciolopsis buskii TaxID=27845 RepID=A0A8E0S1V5_9TREM|nr:putative aminopeptidase [Fasciolopsis buski]